MKIHRISILFTLLVLTLSFFLWFTETPIGILSKGYTTLEDRNFLFIAENNADNALVLSIAQTLNITADFLDIKTSDDLNQLFNSNNLFMDYSVIILSLNQIPNPLNDSITPQLSSFISNGGLFGIISSQIWRFSGSFHSLLGLVINSQGQKEYPLGNISEQLEFTVINETLCQQPIFYPNNSKFSVEGVIGITSAINHHLMVAQSQNTSNGNACINAFQEGKGYVISAPISPVTISASLENLSNFLSSIIGTGLNILVEFEPSENSDFPIIPKLLFNDEILNTVTIIGGLSLLIFGLVYVVSQWLFIQQKTILDLPKDRKMLETLFLGPILFIGHILYPPIIRRLDDYDVTDNEYRNQILDILVTKDFLHFRELKRELDIGTSSLRWHLQVLEDFRLINRTVIGQYEIYYLLNNTPDPIFLEIYFAIISGGGYKVAQAFKESKSWELSLLADYIGQSRESVRYHCKKLEKLNLLTLNGQKYHFNSEKYNKFLLALERRRKTQ
ncbi:hypothetical protein [Candidatus Hodarchaeum mangrovi]